MIPAWKACHNYGLRWSQARGLCQTCRRATGMSQAQPPIVQPAPPQRQEPASTVTR